MFSPLLVKCKVVIMSLFEAVTVTRPVVAYAPVNINEVKVPDTSNQKKNCTR